MLVNALLINGKQRKPKDPVVMCMDFTFDAGNAWADGFRIQVTHDLNANPLQTVSDRLVWARAPPLGGWSTSIWPSAQLDQASGQ